MAIAQEAILLNPVYVVSINGVCHPLVSGVISWLLRYMGDNGVSLGRRFSSITCLSLAAVLLLFSSLGKCSAVASGLWWLVSCTIIGFEDVWKLYLSSTEEKLWHCVLFCT